MNSLQTQRSTCLKAEAGKAWYTAVPHALGARLLLADAGEVPDHEAAVSAAAGQDGLILWAPAYLEHLLIVVLKRVQGLPQVPDVMQRHLPAPSCCFIGWTVHLAAEQVWYHMTLWNTYHHGAESHMLYVCLQCIILL